MLIESKDGLSLVLVTPDRLSRWWEIAIKGMKAVLAKGHNEVSPEDVRDGIISQRLALWIVLLKGEYAGFMVVETIESGSGKWLSVPFGYSRPVKTRDRASLFSDAMGLLEGAAREAGFTGLKFLSSRPGFRKVAPLSGYTPRFVEYVKEF